MLFEKIIEISQGKNVNLKRMRKKYKIIIQNDSKDLGKTSVSRKRLIAETVEDNAEPTLHYFYRKKQAEQIAEENESMAKRIIHQ